MTACHDAHIWQAYILAQRIKCLQLACAIKPGTSDHWLVLLCLIHLKQMEWCVRLKTKLLNILLATQDKIKGFTEIANYVIMQV